MAPINTYSSTGVESLADYTALAELRIAIFKGWPYLYQGSLEYERDYLQKYATCAHSVIVIAKDSEQIIGASTAVPLIAADPSFQNAFSGSDYAIDDIFYLGESALLPEYRGQGIGHQFFDARETQARLYGSRIAAFCAIDREMNDPRRPTNYRELDTFWQKRGYVHHPEIKAKFNWSEVGQSVESMHSLSFWIKEL